MRLDQGWRWPGGAGAWLLGLLLAAPMAGPAGARMPPASPRALVSAAQADPSGGTADEATASAAEPSLEPEGEGGAATDQEESKALPGGGEAVEEAVATPPAAETKESVEEEKPAPSTEASPEEPEVEEGVTEGGEEPAVVPEDQAAEESAEPSPEEEEAAPAAEIEEPAEEEKAGPSTEAAPEEPEVEEGVTEGVEEPAVVPEGEAAEESAEPSPEEEEAVEPSAVAAPTGERPGEGAAVPATSTKKKDKRKTVSSAELAQVGFFQDFSELSLEALLEPEEERVTTSVASGTELSVEEAPGMVTVVTADEIRALGVVTLADVLRTLPGLDVTVDGLGRPRLVARGIPTGGLAALSESVLVLVNGRRIDDAISGGATALNLDLPVEGVAKVELLRGPASALYGSGALGAVVNIVTVAPEAFRGVRVTSTIGSEGTAHVAQLVNTFRDLKVAGTIRYVNAWGADLTLPADAQTLRDQAAPGKAPLSLAPGKAPDGHTALETLYRVELGKLDAQWRVYQGTSDTYTGYTHSLGDQGSQFSKQSLFHLRYRDEIERVGSLSVSAGLASSDNRQLFEVWPPGLEGVLTDGRDFRVDSAIFLQTALKTTRRELEARLTREEGPHRLSAALSLNREATRDLEATANLDFSTGQPGSGMNVPGGQLDKAARTTLALAVQDVWRQTSGVTLTGGLRLDRLSDVGTRLSPRAALVAPLPRDLTLKVLWSTGFRAPTFAESYFDLPGFTGNPDLAAVTAQTFDAGLTLKQVNLRVAANVYYSRVRRLILADRPASPFVSPELENGPGLDVTGLELEGYRTIGYHTLFATYSYQRSRLTDGGGPVPDLPAHLATLGANLAVGPRQTLTLTWLMRSSRPRAEGDSRPALGGYGIVNAHLDWTRVVKRLDLSLAVRNLFGREYEDPAPPMTVPGDYPRPGRSVILFGRYRF